MLESPDCRVFRCARTRSRSRPSSREIVCNLAAADLATNVDGFKHERHIDRMEDPPDTGVSQSAARESLRSTRDPT